MNDNPANALLEEKLRAALGSPKSPDFDGWLSQHKAAVAYLNPITTARLHNKRTLLTWAGRAMVALAACALVAIFWKNGGEEASFAQAITAVESAQTVTWKTTVYSRAASKDGKQTWLMADRMVFAYKSPGHYRATWYDHDGKTEAIEIVDQENKKFLYLNIKSKRATWKNQLLNLYGSDGPMSALASGKILEHKDVALVGQRKVGDTTANVFRFHLRGDGSSFDVWVDANTKQLLGYSSPGADVFDPDTMADRNNPPGKFFRATILGGITDNIVVDAKLDDKLFDMTIPEGFEVVIEPPFLKVTEADMIEYLGTSARFNGGVFGERLRGFDLKQFNAAAKKQKTDRTDAEQKMIDLWDRHMKNRTTTPWWDFAEEYAEPKTFRYIGEGVKLGDADRIVCWYKLKDTGKWRAVYGDLSVKDVDPKDLPLSVK
jgi:outer membrane lipoprotein-sorting protein